MPAYFHPTAPMALGGRADSAPLDAESKLPTGARKSAITKTLTAKSTSIQPQPPAPQPLSIIAFPAWSAIAQAVEFQLKSNRARAFRSVRCDFHEGVLTARGRVATFYLKQLVQTIAAATPGVEEVINQVVVDSRPEAPGLWPR